jgi:hypothetical protein
MIFSRARARSCQLDEIRDVESYENPALLGRQSKQLEVIERFERDIA